MFRDRRLTNACLLLLLAFAFVRTGDALEPVEFSGLAHGYPEMRDLNGKPLADGEFLQWLENDGLHIRIVNRFNDGRRTEENGVVRQKPQIVQTQWSWRESRNGETLREFAVDFGAQTATAQKRENGEVKRWDEKVAVEPGRTFAGFGFTIALQNLRKQLVAGERIELKAIGFAPKPQAVTVLLSHAGVERMTMGGREVEGDRFTIHPQIPAIAKLFVKVPDTQIWLTHPAPAGFLRWEGPLAEPNDQIVRVDLLPGGSSEAARPSKESNAK